MGIGKPSKHELRDFKPGDMVVVVYTDWPDLIPLGATGVVDHLSSSNVWLEWDKHPHLPNAKRPVRLGIVDGGYMARRFEFYNPNCIYCGAKTEYSDKYQVCTECYRVQEE